MPKSARRRSIECEPIRIGKVASQLSIKGAAMKAIAARYKRSIAISAIVQASEILLYRFASARCSGVCSSGISVEIGSSAAVVIGWMPGVT